MRLKRRFLCSSCLSTRSSYSYINIYIYISTRMNKIHSIAMLLDFRRLFDHKDRERDTSRREENRSKSSRRRCCEEVSEENRRNRFCSWHWSTKRRLFSIRIEERSRWVQLDSVRIQLATMAFNGWIYNGIATTTTKKNFVRTYQTKCFRLLVDDQGSLKSMICSPWCKADTFDRGDHLNVRYRVMVARRRQTQFTLIRLFTTDGQCSKSTIGTCRWGWIGVQCFENTVLWTGAVRFDARF